MREFVNTTGELLDSDQVRMMGRWKHHGPITTLDHSLFVAYLSFRAARALGLDEVAAARGGLLHDLCRSDSKDTSAHTGWPCFGPPRAAASNQKTSGPQFPPSPFHFCRPPGCSLLSGSSS